MRVVPGFRGKLLTGRFLASRAMQMGSAPYTPQGDVRWRSAGARRRRTTACCRPRSFWSATRSRRATWTTSPTPTFLTPRFRWYDPTEKLRSHVAPILVLSRAEHDMKVVGFARAAQGRWVRGVSTTTACSRVDVTVVDSRTSAVLTLGWSNMSADGEGQAAGAGRWAGNSGDHGAGRRPVQPVLLHQPLQAQPPDFRGDQQGHRPGGHHRRAGRGSATGAGLRQLPGTLSRSILTRLLPPAQRSSPASQCKPLLHIISATCSGPSVVLARGDSLGPSALP